MKPTPRSTAKGAEEARQQLPAILADAAAGRTTIVTRHGHAVAAIVPVSQAKSRKPASLLALAGSGKGLWGKESATVIDKLRGEWGR